eukprot:scaffold9522_cov195-Skeletonema_dohrnii-CCMP3373.AAC.7
MGNYLLVSGVSCLILSSFIIVIGTSHFTDSNHEGIKTLAQASCWAEGPELKGALICMDPFNVVALWSLTYIFGNLLRKGL